MRTYIRDVVLRREDVLSYVVRECLRGRPMGSCVFTGRTVVDCPTLDAREAALRLLRGVITDES